MFTSLSRPCSFVGILSLSRACTARRPTLDGLLSPARSSTLVLTLVNLVAHGFSDARRAVFSRQRAVLSHDWPRRFRRPNAVAKDGFAYLPITLRRLAWPCRPDAGHQRRWLRRGDARFDDIHCSQSSLLERAVDRRFYLLLYTLLWFGADGRRGIENADQWALFVTYLLFVLGFAVLGRTMFNGTSVTTSSRT